MKRHYQLFFLLISLLTATFLSGCASTAADPNAAFRGESLNYMFQTAQHDMARKKYARAIKRYEAMDALYPFSPYSEEADLNLIYAYYQNGDSPQATCAADRFTKLYPRSPYVDYAFYMKGLAGFEQDRGWVQKYLPSDLSQRDPGVARQSFDDFGTLIRLFPNSCYAADARQHMIYLRNLLGAYELHVAKYYLRRGAYVGAANRANYIIQHYDGTPSVQEALGVLVLSYNALGLPELAYQSWTILQMNYPNGCVIRALMQHKFG